MILAVGIGHSAQLSSAQLQEGEHWWHHTLGSALQDKQDEEAEAWDNLGANVFREG